MLRNSLMAATLISALLIGAGAANADPSDQLKRSVVKADRAVAQARPAMQMATGAAVAKPEVMYAEILAELKRCMSDDTLYVKKDYNISAQFTAAARAAGHASSNGAFNFGVIPTAFLNQKQMDYCSYYVDPPYFAHHISQSRQCSLSVTPYMMGGGSIGATAELTHSGCYDPSSVATRPSLKWEEAVALHVK